MEISLWIPRAVNANGVGGYGLVDLLAEEEALFKRLHTIGVDGGGGPWRYLRLQHRAACYSAPSNNQHY